MMVRVQSPVHFIGSFKLVYISNRSREIHFECRELGLTPLCRTSPRNVEKQGGDQQLNIILYPGEMQCYDIIPIIDMIIFVNINLNCECAVHFPRFVIFLHKYIWVLK